MSIDTATAKATAWQHGWQDYLANVHTNPYDINTSITSTGGVATAMPSRPSPRPSTWSLAMHEFKPGDLALVVGAFRITENIGKTVRVEEFLADGQVSRWTDDKGRHTRNDCGSGGWLVSASDLQSGCKGRKGFALIDPKHLMPLRGDFAPERQKSQEVPA